MNGQCQYADVIVDITSERLDRPFSYRIPEMMEDVRPGMVVMVPFGKGDRLIRGYVVGISDKAPVQAGKTGAAVRRWVPPRGASSVVFTDQSGINRRVF